MRIIAALFLLFNIVRATIELDGNVLVLNDDNWKEAISKNTQLLVEFYAPWCGHCKSLAPEWAKAADTLAGQSVKLAKVDATEATGLAKEFAIKGFPTIKYFNKGKPSDYSGGRTEKDIVNWVSKKTGPSARTVATDADLEVLKEGNDVSVLGVFASADSANARRFLAFADDHDDVVFAIATTEEVRSSLGVAHDTVVVLRSFDEPRVDLSVEDSFDEKALAAFVASETVPLVYEFSQASSKKIFSSPVTKHALFFTSKAADHHKEVLATFNTVAKSFRGQALFVNVPQNSETQRVLDFFDLTTDKLPAAIFADMNPEGGSMKRFPYSGAFDVEPVSDFVTQFLAGSLKPVLKSEEPNESDTAGDVVVVKGKSFNDIVIANTKDVFIEFYAPWCGHCKNLAPTWDALGKQFKGTDVVIAKMDATANEIDYPGLAVKGFPTLYWLRGDNKASPVKYEGGRELDDLVEYISKHAANSVPASAADQEEEDHDEL